MEKKKTQVIIQAKVIDEKLQNGAGELKEMIAQRSDDWFAQRLGKFTASTFGDLIGKGKAKDRNFTDKGITLIMKKLSERLTGEREEISGKALEWGTENEPHAIELYEKISGNKVKEAPFIPLEGFEDYAGGSPDGIIDGGIIEVKCPFNSGNHLHTLIHQEIPKKSYVQYYTQMQYNMLCTGTPFCDFISFDPRMILDKNKIVIVRINRDEEHIAKILEKLNLAIEFVNTILKDLGRNNE